MSAVRIRSWLPIDNWKRCELADEGSLILRMYPAPVGGLPAKADWHPTSMSTVTPPSPASRLLQGIGDAHKSCGRQLACQRRGRVSRHRCRLSCRLRRQAGSYRESGAHTNPVAGEIPCRSWLASEEAVSVDIDVGCQSAFASKPAPTGIAAYTNIATGLTIPDPKRSTYCHGPQPPPAGCSCHDGSS
jgi:hypothetical protein